MASSESVSDSYVRRRRTTAFQPRGSACADKKASMKRTAVMPSVSTDATKASESMRTTSAVPLDCSSSSGSCASGSLVSKSSTDGVPCDGSTTHDGAATTSPCETTATPGTTSDIVSGAIVSYSGVGGSSSCSSVDESRRNSTADAFICAL